MSRSTPAKVSTVSTPWRRPSRRNIRACPWRSSAGPTATTIPRVDTELATNTSGGDLVVTASPGWVQTQAQAGSWVDPTASPQLAGLGDYDAELYLHDGNYFEVGAAVLTFAWNTNDVPDGLSAYADLLDPELAGGRIAVIDPAIGPAVVDFYLWLEESFGEDYVEQLAAQEPRIYPSALPIGEALTSGEVSAAAYAAPTQLVPAAEAGAPVDFGVDEAGAWAARFFGVIPKSVRQPQRGGPAGRLHGHRRGPRAGPSQRRFGARRPQRRHHQRPCTGHGPRSDRPGAGCRLRREVERPVPLIQPASHLTTGRSR